MRSSAWLALLGVTLAAQAVIRALREFRELSGGSCPEPADLPDSAEECEAAERIAATALDHAEFRSAWDDAVRSVADAITARLAGAWMASGCPDVAGVAISWEGSVHLPECPGVCPERAWGVFQQAVQAEVSRRAAAMSGPGGPG